MPRRFSPQLPLVELVRVCLALVIAIAGIAFVGMGCTALLVGHWFGLGFFALGYYCFVLAGRTYPFSK